MSVTLCLQSKEIGIVRHPNAKARHRAGDKKKNPTAANITNKINFDGFIINPPKKGSLWKFLQHFIELAKTEIK